MTLEQTKMLAVAGVTGLFVLAGFLIFSNKIIEEKANNNLASVNVSEQAEIPAPTFTDDNTGETVIIKSDQEK